MHGNILPTGKLPPELLARLLAEVPPHPRVIVGPRPGEDAAVIDMGDRYLVAKTDPITFATDNIGWYAVQVNANDIAVTGARPLWFLATILLPAGQADPSMARRIVEQISTACRALDIALVGGHTEVTHSLGRPVVVGCMLGEVDKDALIVTGGAQVGDLIFLTKGAPIEATAIMAVEKRPELESQFTPAFLDRCADMLFDPGISVVRDARLALEVGGVTSMHDPTEGGVLSGLWELSEACGHGLRVRLNGDQVPWLPEGQQLCQAFGLDPAKAIASGALLMTVRPETAEEMVPAFGRAGIPLFVLGQVVREPVGVSDELAGELARPARDDITKIFD